MANAEKGFISWGDLLGLAERLPRLLRSLLAWRFKRVFGRDAAKGLHVIYNVSIPPDGIVYSKPKPKVKRDNYRQTKSLRTINSCASTRAIGYLVHRFGEMFHAPPIISSDVDTDDRMDISFVSIGGVNNLKTCDLLRDDSNHFIDYAGRKRAIVDRSSGLPVVQCSGSVARGFIIKIHPRSNPRRAWLCCAGFEEWGTSGAAWYLATKWRAIYRWAKQRPFAIITETEPHSDESTKAIYRFLTPAEVTDAAKRTAAPITTTTTVSSTTTTSQTTVTAPGEPIQ